jgi:exopolysaccharide biosynthesis predicted pyruvyltransferase EpsI
MIPFGRELSRNSRIIHTLLPQLVNLGDHVIVKGKVTILTRTYVHIEGRVMARNPNNPDSHPVNFNSV